MSLELTIEALRSAKFRGPTRFMDGRNGMAQQDFECVDDPRFGYFWRRENRADRGRQAYMVDGKEVADLQEAIALLGKAADPDSPAQRDRRDIDEFKASPKLNYGATRALSEARCNADAGPFQMVRAWLQRSDNAWHVGINAYADSERKEGRETPWWLYEAKTAAQETYRGMYLFAAERAADTDLICEMGVKCRECPILKQVEASMIEARTRKPFPYDIEDHDIDAAKTWVCISHILTHKGMKFIDGGFWRTKADREDMSIW